MLWHYTSISGKGAAASVGLLRLLVEVQTQVAHVLALLHQLVQVLAPLQEVVEVLVADLLHLLQLVLQLL